MPANKQYTNTYEAKAKGSGVTISNLGDSSFKSFMANPDNAFQDTDIVEKAENGGQDKTRRSVILSVRENIQKRMQEVNEDSHKSSQEMANNHSKSGGDIIKLIQDRKGIIRKRKNLEFEYARLSGNKSGSDRLKADMMDYYTNVYNSLNQPKADDGAKGAAGSSSVSNSPKLKIKDYLATLNVASAKKAANPVNDITGLSTSTVSTTVITDYRLDDDDGKDKASGATAPNASTGMASGASMDASGAVAPDPDNSSGLSTASDSAPGNLADTSSVIDPTITTTTTGTVPASDSAAPDTSAGTAPASDTVSPDASAGTSPASDTASGTAPDTSAALTSSGSAADTSSAASSPADATGKVGGTLGPASASAPIGPFHQFDDVTNAIKRNTELTRVAKLELLVDISAGNKLYDKMQLDRGPYFARIRKWSNRRDYDGTTKDLTSNKAKILQKINNWKKEYDKYHSSTVKKYNNSYDSLATTWYELTREYTFKSDNQSAAEVAKLNDRKIAKSAAKNIEEYSGLFDVNGFDALYNSLNANPYISVQTDALPKRSVLPKHAIASDNPLYVKYDQIVMRSAPDEQGNSQKLRFNRKFLTMQNGSVIHAQDAHLAADQRDIYDSYLYSEKNADIVSARTKKTGERVYGFYLNGEFVTDEALKNPGDKLSTASDMKYFGRKSWDKLKKAQKLRDAIRTSAFFKHVNSSTIQLYTGYNAAEDFGQKFDAKMLGKYSKREDELKDGVTKATFMQDIANKLPLDTLLASADAVTGHVAAEYIIHYYNDQNTDKSSIDYSSVENKVILNNEYIKDYTTRLLLEEGKPELWNRARALLINHPDSVSMRTREMIKLLPAKGEMMRVGLLDELVNHQDTFSEYSPETTSLTGLLDVPELKVHQEELKSMRGFRAWFERNLLNGFLLKQGLSFASTGVSAGYLIQDADNMFQNPVLPDEKLAREKDALWMEFGTSMTEGSRMMGLIEGVLATGGAIIGESAIHGFPGEGASYGGLRGATVALDTAYVVNSIDDLIYVFYKGAQACRHIYKLNKDPEYKKQFDESLQSYTGTEEFVKEFSTWLQKLVSTLQNLMGVNAVETSETVTDRVPINDPFSLGGPVQKILSAIKDVLKFVNAVADVVISSKHISRMDIADEDLESALQEMLAERARVRSKRKGSDKKDSDDNAPDAATKKKLELGKAVEENAQSQFFMALSKKQAHKERAKAGFAIGSSTLSFVGNVLGAALDLSNPAMMKATAAFQIAPAIVDFLGWTVGKIFYDLPNFQQSIAMMLGDKSYAFAPYFDDVLKQETGIVSKDYLLDVAKIFMTIDTQVLINNPRNEGDKELGNKVLSALYNNVSDTTRQKSSLSEMLKYAGLSEGTNWRSLLRLSLSAGR